MNSAFIFIYVQMHVDLYILICVCLYILLDERPFSISVLLFSFFGFFSFFLRIQRTSRCSNWQIANLNSVINQQETLHFGALYLTATACIGISE